MADLAVRYGQDGVEELSAVIILDGTARGALAAGDEVARIEPEDPAETSTWILPLGDVDGDGVDDLGVTVHGVASLFRGPLVGVQSSADADTFFSELSLDSPAGDFDGDGRDDVIAAHPYDGWGERTAVGYVLSPTDRGTYSAADAWLELSGEWYGSGSACGLLVEASGGGDVDGDGAADLLVKFDGDALGAPNSSGTWILSGPASGSVEPDPDDPHEVLLDGAFVATGPLQLDDDGLADLVFVPFAFANYSIHIVSGATIEWFFE